MKINNLPRFEDSDAFLFFDVARKGRKDLGNMSHFLASMPIWDKTLLKAIDKQRGLERE